MSDGPFGSVQEESDIPILEEAVRQYEARYFPGVKPVTGLEIEDILGPAQLCLQTFNVQLNRSVVSYPRTARVLILHELINNKLYQDGKLLDGGRLLCETNRSAYEALIQVEVDRLWKLGAYMGLL
jgi:hypothetical protein